MNNISKILLVAGSALAVGFIVHVLPTLADIAGPLLPVSDGSYTQWTPLSSSTHYTMVDEAYCNGTTDYNYTNTVGNRDSYGINTASIPDGSTINSIDVVPCASANLATTSTSTLKVFFRSGGWTFADTGSYTLSTTTPTMLATTTLSTFGLLKSPTSTLEIGAILFSGSAGARLSQISAVINYTPLGAPSSLTATTTSTSTVALAWVDNASGELGYKIERGTDGVHFAKIGTAGTNATSYNDSGLTSGTYYYRVRAYNYPGNSAYSNTASAILP